LKESRFMKKASKPTQPKSKRHSAPSESDLQEEFTKLLSRRDGGPKVNEANLYADYAPRSGKSRNTA
jgi:hypothetical protein